MTFADSIIFNYRIHFKPIRWKYFNKNAQKISHSWYALQWMSVNTFDFGKKNCNLCEKIRINKSELVQFIAKNECKIFGFGPLVLISCVISNNNIC